MGHGPIEEVLRHILLALRNSLEDILKGLSALPEVHIDQPAKIQHVRVGVVNIIGLIQLLQSYEDILKGLQLVLE